MARSYKFCVIQFRAHPLRDERLNLGIAIFKDHTLDVRVPQRLDKLRAISAALNVENVRDSLAQLPRLDELSRKNSEWTPEHRHIELSENCPFQLSQLGEFIAPDGESYERQVVLLLGRLVEPEPAPAGFAQKRLTGLLKSVKTELRFERVLAKKGEGLDTHRVVTNHQIAEGLKADLLLKNGAMHVVETVDASTDDASLRRAIAGIAVSALIFEQARMLFGAECTKTRLIYVASSKVEKSITPSLQAAEHQGAQLINWESGDQRRAFIADLARLAVPLERKTKGNITNIDASIQPRFKLN